MPAKKSVIRRINRKLKKVRKGLKDSPLGFPVTVDEVNAAMMTLKPGKASGIDNMFPEFYINMGNKAKSWLAKFFTECYRNAWIPRIWKQTKVRAILKPEKDKNSVDSYRPISLLCICYKILERIVYNRISSIIHANIPNDQAGFMPKRSCCDQVLALTTHIEAGFQDKLRTAIVFVDLSSAFDTVWRNALLLKLTKVIRCKITIDLIASMLTNRRFRVHMGEKTSSTKTLNSGLAQGGVLSPLLFLLYISDLPETKARKFIFADDLALAIQYGYSLQAEKMAVKALNSDLKKLANFYELWKLRANPSKTEVTTFHLSNRKATRTIKVKFCGKNVKYNFFPKYLGNTLDRSLTFNTHLTKLSGKIKSRCNIIQKLAGTSWGASGNTLRISSLSLVYSAAEYCSPVWSHSAHTDRVDNVLNECQRIITGTIQSTPLPWLPVLSNIMPSNIRRNVALVREVEKIYADLDLPIHQDLNGRVGVRLPSRNPLWMKIQELGHTNYSPKDEWLNYWNENRPTNSDLIADPNDKLPGFDLSRKNWRTLNRIRTNHGRCNYTLHKWNPSISTECDCGHPSQTIHHIVTECQNRKFGGQLHELNQVTNDGVTWLSGLDIDL